MRTTHAISSTIALALLLASGAASATVTNPPAPTCAIIKRGVRGDITDNFIWDKYPGVNNGTYVETATGLSSSGGEKRALIGFDLSSVPSMATVSSAKLYLLSNSNYAGAVRAYRMLAPWTETGSTWNNVGAKDPGVIATFNAGGYNKWVNLDLTSVVQAWVNGEANHGIILEEGLLTGSSYKSSETATAANKPYLEICYTDPQSSIGDVVFFDANADTIRDEGEQGIANVVIDLFADTDCDGAADGAALSAVVTDAAGLYKFENLTPGCYVVDVDGATVPQGHVLTTLSEPLHVNLGIAEDFADADFGYVTLSSIGDTVWLDSDADGVFDSDAGELGVNGVVVELFEDGVYVDYTVTGDSPYTGHPGFYLFDSLQPGNYSVRVADGNFLGGGALHGHEQTYDLDGALDAAAAVSLGAGVDFLTVDFGYQLSCGNGVCQGGVGETSITCAADCPPVCGDGACQGAESWSTCAVDCPTVCGDGACQGDETWQNCTADCLPVCGDGACNGDEDWSTCIGDCPAVCGDAACNGAEDWTTCAADCPPACGDGACNGDESCSTCVFDCGECAPTCGDGTCNGSENSLSCPDDCPAVCGNYLCDAVEDCWSCPSDCLTCPAICGDGHCTFEESCSTCAGDCGQCPPPPPVCGDGACNGNEDCSSCKSDCGKCQDHSPGTGSCHDWEDRDNDWPVDKLHICGKWHHKKHLKDILKHATKKDMTYDLMKELIAAKFNVGKGNKSSCIEPTIIAAEQWLAAHPLGSNVKSSSSAWTGSNQGKAIRDKLEDYNEGKLCAQRRRRD